MSRANPWSTLPTSLPTGGLMPHMSARLRHEIVDAVFFASGGFDRLLAFTEASEDNYKFFLNLWAKGLPRVSNAEVAVNADGIESLIARLDAGEHATVVSPDVRPPGGSAPADLDLEPA